MIQIRDNTTVNARDIEALKRNPDSKYIFATKEEQNIIDVFFLVPIVQGEFVYPGLKDTLIWNQMEPKEYVPLMYSLLRTLKGK